MSSRRTTPTPDRLALLRWTVALGAVTADALAYREATTLASARAKLNRAAGDGLLLARRPLTDRPALYTATSAGIRAVGSTGLGPARVSAAGAQHMIACAHVAAALERDYPECEVIGERELRRRERAAGVALASAVLSGAGHRGQLLHRPDLVVWPWSAPGARGLPLAVEVELTIKAPRRLAEICRAWARSRRIEGVLYLAPDAVGRALERAIASTRGGERVVVVPLEALPLHIDV